MKHRNGELKTPSFRKSMPRHRSPNLYPQALSGDTMLPTPELEIARNLAAREGCCARRSRALHALAGDAPLREFQRGFVAAAAATCTSISTMSTPIAAGRTISATKFPIPHARSKLLDAWEEELRACYAMARGPSHPVLIALRETIRAKDIPHRAVSAICCARFGRTRRVHRYATWDGVLDYCVYSANPVGRLVLYLCGYRDSRAAEAFRFHLHGAAAREFLAGRLARPRKRPHLYSARSARRARADAKRTLSRGDSTSAT